MKTFLPLLLIVCLISSSALGETITPQSVVACSGPIEGNYSASLSCDGNLDSYSALRDDTPTGSDDALVPPRGEAPITGHIVYDLGKPMFVYGVQIIAPRNNFYAPKNIDVFFLNPGDTIDKHPIADDWEGDAGLVLLAKNRELPYFDNGQSRFAAFEGQTARYVGIRFNDAHNSTRMKWRLNQFAEIRFLGCSPEDAQKVDLKREKIGNKTIAELIEDQNFREYRKVKPYPQERLVLDWLRQDRYPQRDLSVKQTDVSDCFASQTSNELERQLIEKALADIQKLDPQTDLAAFKATAAELAQNNVSGGDSRWRNLYVSICQIRRTLRLKTVAQFASEYVFAKHCQLVNQPCFASTAFLSDSVYKDRLGDWRMGSELYKMSISESGEVSIELLLDQPTGIIRDPSVSFDGKTLAFSQRANENEDYHLYTMSLDKKEAPKQISFGPGTADFEPCWLPNGDLVFTSSRCDISVPCWSSDVTNLYSCNASGAYLRRLSFDHAHNVSPHILNDGRIIYTRWEYNDRNSAPCHKLFLMNADGTGQTEYYGNNSITPWSLIHACAIPGSHKTMAIASGHHTDQAGLLLRIDRTKGTQEDEGLEYIAPERSFEPISWDFNAHDGLLPLFQFPCPIDENNFLVSYVQEGSANPRGFYPTPYGIYWMNSAGDRELLVFDPTISSGQIVPIKERPAPPQKAPGFDLNQSEGYFYVQNVYYGPGLEGVKPGTIKKIRIVALDNRAMSAGVDYMQPTAQVHTPVSVGNGSWDVKHVIGTVDVEQDGSCYFRCPPRMGVYFQALDENGNMVQTMRSWAMVMPGETFGCIGCHEGKNDTFKDGSRAITTALKKPAQKIQPFYQPEEIAQPEFYKTLTDSQKKAMAYLNVNAPQRQDAPQGFSYLRDIQPIWDAHCIQCHNSDCYNEEMGETPKTDAAGKKQIPLNLLGDTGNYCFETAWKGLTNFTASKAKPYINSGRDMNPGREYAISYLELTNYGRNITAKPIPVHPAANADSKRIVHSERPPSGMKAKYVNWIPMGDSKAPMIPADFWGARHSLIMKYLEPSHYNVQLSAREKELVGTWIDLCVPYCGSYMEANTWDRITHTYIHFYRDQLIPAYLFEEQQRLEHAEVEVAHLEKWIAHREKGTAFTLDDFPKFLCGGLEVQQKFIEQYRDRGKTLPFANVSNPDGNLAFNPTDTVFSATSWPHVSSNSHLKYRYEFAPTKVNDGNPNTFWRPLRRSDVWLKVEFGKEIEASQLVVQLRLESGQTKTWTGATIEFSNGYKQKIKFQCDAAPQEFTFPKQTCEWVRLIGFEEQNPRTDNGIAELKVW